jgi:hypothetical protein
MNFGDMRMFDSFDVRAPADDAGVGERRRNARRRAGRNGRRDDARRTATASRTEAPGEIVTKSAYRADVRKYPLFKKPFCGLGAGAGHDAGLSRARFRPTRPDDGTAKEASRTFFLVTTANLVFSLGFFIFLLQIRPVVPGYEPGPCGSVALRRFATNMTDGVIRWWRSSGVLFDFAPERNSPRV